MIDEKLKEKVIGIYKETNDFYKTVEKSKISKKLVHIILRQANVLKIKDKIRYGTKSQKRGAEAEQFFQKNVPKAINANEYWKINNPIFDFYYEGLTIDVKYSSLCKRERNGKTNYYWSFRTFNDEEKLPDLYVVFLERKRGLKLNGVLCMVIPSEFIIQRNSITITPKNEFYKDFIVEVEDLENEIKLYINKDEDDEEEYEEYEEYEAI